MELLALNSDHHKVEEQIQVCPEYISEIIQFWMCAGSLFI